jgi:hypothetical protein
MLPGTSFFSGPVWNQRKRGVVGELSVTEADMDGVGLEDIIRMRAYFLWEQDGRPEGRAEEYWQRAESQIKGDQPAWPSKGRGSVQGSENKS